MYSVHCTQLYTWLLRITELNQRSYQMKHVSEISRFQVNGKIFLKRNLHNSNESENKKNGEYMSWCVFVIWFPYLAGLCENDSFWINHSTFFAKSNGNIKINGNVIYGDVFYSTFGISFLLKLANIILSFSWERWHVPTHSLQSERIAR